MASQYQSLRAPHVVLSSWETLAQDLTREAGGPPAFDAIVGRNTLTRAADRPGRLALVASLLSSNGTAVLAETVPALGQRLTPLLTPGGSEQELVSALAGAENALMSDQENVLVNWNPVALSNLAGLRLSFFNKTYKLVRKFTKKEIEHWFRKAGAGEPKSLGDFLRRTSGDSECQALQGLFDRQLLHRDCEWRETVAFLIIKKL